MNQETLEHLVHALRHMYLASTSLFRPEVPRIARIPMHGPIQFQATAPKFHFGSSNTVITPRYVERTVKRALDDDVVGLIFDINSPGGEVVPSGRIAEYIHELEVPTVALVQNVAASGAYLIASACDTVVADENSIVGSIGVLLPLFDLTDFAAMVGIKYRGLKAGEHKNMGNPLVEMPEDHKRILQEWVDYSHQKFIEDVARYRNMPVEDVRALATGRIYIGEEAQELYLVDMFGDMKEAKEYIKAAKGLKQARVVDYSENSFPFPFLSSFAAAFGYSIGDSIAKRIATEIHSEASGNNLKMY